MLPGIGLLFLLINLFLARLLYQSKEPSTASHILLLAALFAQMGVLIASISLVLVNY